MTPDHPTANMNQKRPYLAVLILTAISIVACKQPSPFGADLLQDEFSEYVFTDTISLRCTLEREDSTLTSDRSSTAEYFLCGELNDPQFGKSASQIYALMLGKNLNPNFKPSTQTFDSIVLYLRYAVGGFYGDTTQEQTLRVFRVDPNQSISPSANYYSNKTIPASEELGSVSFFPKPTKVDSLFDGIKGPFIRVALKPEFGQELFNLDSISYSVDSFFMKQLRGLKIVSTTNGAAPGAIMAFNLNNTALSRMRLFYHDTIARNFDYYFTGANKFTHFDHDHSGSQAGQQIGQQLDDYLFVQGMQGLRVKIEFPYAQNLDKIAVNRAQMVLTVADETAALKPASQLFFTQLQGDTVFVLSSDVVYSFGPTFTGGFSSFGGTPREVFDNGTTVKRYRLTLSDQFQEIVDDDNSTNTKKRTVYLGVYPRSRTAERAILFGPQNLSFPAKLELTYTKVR